MSTLSPELVAELERRLAEAPPLGPVQIELLAGLIAPLIEVRDDYTTDTTRRGAA